MFIILPFFYRCQCRLGIRTNYFCMGPTSFLPLLYITIDRGNLQHMKRLIFSLYICSVSRGLKRDSFFAQRGKSAIRTKPRFHFDHIDGRIAQKGTASYEAVLFFIYLCGFTASTPAPAKCCPGRRCGSPPPGTPPRSRPRWCRRSPPWTC